MIDDFKRPHFIIALLIVGLFAWAYGENTNDDTMKGALIGAFNLAIGFYLGNVIGREKASENTGKAFEAITAAANSSPAADTNAIHPGDTVTLNTEKTDEEDPPRI